MKELLLAESAGFCFGVSRSVSMAEQALESGEPVWCLGELIHNTDEVERLKASGLRQIDEPEQLPEGARVIIRSHGVGREVYERLKKRGAQIIDATCPKVAHIHTIVSDAAAQGRKVLIIGAAEHPEVRGIVGWCGEHAVVSGPEELENYANTHPEEADMPLTAVFQTTQTKEIQEKSKNFIKKFYTNCKVFDTICFATQIRQAQALDLASRCDAMVVIGGMHSANSRHLAELCRERCKRVDFIESAQNLDAASLGAFDTVGITAGASVPMWIIKEVKQTMCDEIKEKDTAVEAEKSFEEMLEDSIKTIYNGDTVKGVVAAITPTEISVDLCTKHSG